MRKLLLTLGVVISVAQAQAAQIVDAPSVEPESSGFSFIPTSNLQPDIFSTGRAFGGVSRYQFRNGLTTEFENLNSYTNRAGLSDGAGGVHSSSMMFRGLYEYDQEAWRMKPFIGTGVGMVDVNANLLGVHDSDWVAAYQVKGGVKMAFSQKVMGTFGYNWVKGQKPTLTLRGIPAKVEFPDGGFFLGLNYKLH